jgi:hypothetical protein
MKKKTGILVGGTVALIVGIIIILRASNQQPMQIQTMTQQKTANKGQVTSVQNSANVSASNDPQDIVAGLYKNPIQNTSTQEGFTIIDGKVENNVDNAGKVINDHLELSLKNSAGKDIGDFEIYYQIIDVATGQKEGYYKKLTGFVLKAGETQTIHFDDGTGSGHFRANKNSLYYKSPNKLTFDVMVSASGYKIENIQISKDAGGAEQKD